MLQHICYYIIFAPLNLNKTKNEKNDSTLINGNNSRNSTGTGKLGNRQQPFTGDVYSFSPGNLRSNRKF
ncbi:MAG: hypothetical protein BWY67_01705 [Bacteroidetes bacterium ADurb.Bin397]|nr:MAG: hypothetical protein BWY67_01705 [Bacteroidetes bacterium ADurb.Bin397]